ncbi:DUF4431 domain-containing protein [Steroidobacter sp. S1-65]|uniref:DUF4431 domain-containing protein n=1 Tax=Steroidobacter gossypii TaxID=2805490 RepID=A0ABS1X3G0_9GAMM|nr:DUF4431 domain-containing protein [Steroidobacter gossypii]MBM0107750.1 DUF4431 domain-containing protein [Steroidobacter gossypii]
MTRGPTMWRALIIVGLSGIAPLTSAVEYSCLQYGPNELVGTLVRQTYAGPPDYESVTKGDEPQVIWLLQLDERVCVAANSRYPREPTQIEVELALTEDQYRQYRHLLGRKVVATGELIHGGANYQKSLVLTASELRQTSLVP